MEHEKEKEKEKIQKRLQRNKISFLLISFYSGVISISDLGVKYYLKDEKKMNTSSFTQVLLIIKFAYLIKPIYGLLIDFLPIFGYKKKIYLLLCFFINIFSWYFFILKKNDNLLFAIICQLLINITISFSTVIGSAIQVDISRLQDKKNTIGKGTSDLLSKSYIIKNTGTLIISFSRVFFIDKFSNDVIFYISGIFSIILLMSGLFLYEDKIIKKNNNRIEKKSSFHPLVEPQKKETGNNKLLNLIKNNNILILLLLVLILESSPSCVSPLFYYETNLLGLNPRKMSIIDCASSIAVIFFIYMYNKYFHKYNFKIITFVVRILIFGSFSLIYLLITKSTQEYINDFILLAIVTSLNAGLHNLGQLPYNLICIKYTPFGLEATTQSFSVFSLYLGNIFADYIDYLLASYFNITHYDFTNLGKLVFMENIINLIPLLYVWIIPKRFFSVKPASSPSRELSFLEKTSNDQRSNGKQEKDNDNDSEENRESFYDGLINNIVVEDNNIEDINNEPDLNMRDEHSYRYLSF